MSSWSAGNGRRAWNGCAPDGNGVPRHEATDDLPLLIPVTAHELEVLECFGATAIDAALSYTPNERITRKIKCQG